MFHTPINIISLVIASLFGLVYDYYVVDLLHQRYDRQFGKGFIISGIMAFILPIFTLVSLPIYLLLEWSIPGLISSLFLGVYILILIAAAFILKRRLLSKIFIDPKKSSPTHDNTKIGSI